MRAGLLRIALAALACQLAGAPALAISAIPSPARAGTVMACCLHAGPGHVCPMMHRRMGPARDDACGCAVTASCGCAPATLAAPGTVLLAPPDPRFSLTPETRSVAAGAGAGRDAESFRHPVPSPPPRV
jgi:hypothetical protein